MTTLNAPVPAATPALVDPVPGLDLARPELHRTTDLQGVFTDLRRAHPVFWHGPKSRPGFWSVTRHADVARIYRDAETFSPSHGMTIDTLRPDRDPAAGMMVEVTDPPEHRRLRRGISAFFTAGAVAAMTPAIDRHVAGLLAGIRDRGEPVDLVEAFTARVPSYVAGLLLGLPAEDLDWITTRTAQVFLADDDPDGALRAAAAQANGDLLGYFAKLVRSARPGTTDGLVQRLAAGGARAAGMTTGEVVLNALNLAIAGTQTTRNSLANMVLAMVRFPESFAAVRADPGLVPSAVDECVRWANPVRHLARAATRDVELGGVEIAAGDPVVAWHGSANRDEAVFALPHVFDVRRRPNPHIGFSAGPHGCPGSGMARVQMRSALAHLADLCSGVELTGEPRRLRSNFLDGVERLPARLVPA